MRGDIAYLIVCMTVWEIVGRSHICDDSFLQKRATKYF